MSSPVKILIVEDVASDAELAMRELGRAGIAFEARRVETAAEYRRALEEFKPELILSDFTLPNFDGTQALAIAREHYPDIPFIFVSGSIGEEHAIRALKQGANDYVMKTNLVRLSPAVERAIQEQRERNARRDAESALRASELRKSAIFEVALDSIVTIDAQGRVIEFNPAAESTFGYVRNEILGKELAGLIVPPAQREAHRQGLKHYLASGEGPILGRRIEVTAVRRDGSELPVELTVAPIHLPDMTLFSAHIRDITERKQAEEERAALRERDRALTQALGEIIYDWRPLSDELHWDGDYTQTLGYDAAEMGRNTESWTSRVHPEDLDRVLREVEACALDRRCYDLEYRFCRRDGSYVWMHDRGVPFVDAKARVTRIIGVFSDITERKRAEQELHESEKKYRQLIEQASDGIFVSDAEGNLLLANSRWCELLGYSREEAAGLNARETYVEEERQTHSDRLDLVLAGQTLRFERMVRRRDGSAFPAEISLKMLDNGMIQGIFHDITTRRSQEQKIARLSRIQAVLSGINSAIVRIRDRQQLFQEACRIAVEHGEFSVGWISMLDHASGRLVPVAKAGLSLDLGTAGHSSDQPVGLIPAGIAAVALRQTRPAFDNDIARGMEEAGANESDTLSVRRAAIAVGAKSVIVLPLFVEAKILGILTLYAPERDFFDDEEVKLLTELAGDISFGLEFIAKGEKVDYLAYYDTLTGLPNRSLFFDRLTHQLGTATRDGLNVALVLMDLDRFRMINDTLGRQAGDALITAVAQRIQTTVRDQDTVARVGADGFAVAVSGNWKIADIAHVLEARNDALFGRPFRLGQEELRVSATAGIAVFPGDGDSPEALFANAEAALRKATEQNAGSLFYGPEMNARVADSLRLENRLRRALENGEMVLWYQPKVSVSAREITGFEALMRWQDPETGMVPPARFIPLMEQTGLILDAGRWALSQVARDCGLWKASGIQPPRVAVNVSPLQLRQKDFVATVIEAAEQTAKAGSMLDLELTESVIMENVEAIIRILQTVRGLGVQIAVDDFGTGYSSLAYIARLPIHELKIDRSFVVGMTENQESLAIVTSVISLAHSLRLKVVAEGVETEEQAAQLLKLGCDQMQGYLFSRPVPPDKVPGFLSPQKGAASSPARRRSRKSPGR